MYSLPATGIGSLFLTLVAVVMAGVGFVLRKIGGK